MQLEFVLSWKYIQEVYLQDYWRGDSLYEPPCSKANVALQTQSHRACHVTNGREAPFTDPNSEEKGKGTKNIPDDPWGEVHVVDEIGMSFTRHMHHCSEQIKMIFPLGILTKSHKNALWPDFHIQITEF